MGGVPYKLRQGDTLVLSELTKLYSWRSGLGLVNNEEEEEEPLAKRRKVVVEESAGVGETREELTKVISQRRKMAEVRMLKEKLVLENAVKVGQQRQAALMAEKEMLVARLEEQSKKQRKLSQRGKTRR